jgi:AAA domain/Bifunctional DNA primase/polymerase, N-terminal
MNMLAASDYDTYRTPYHANGYTALHPIGPNSKVPMVFIDGTHKNMIAWQDPNRTVITAPQPGAGIGVRLGLQRPSGLHLIALDWDDDALSNVAMSRFPSAVCKVGKRGHTAFFVSDFEIAPKNYKTNGACRLQILSTGQQTVLPPTVHPDTKEPYWWLDDYTFGNVKIENLPELPLNYLEVIDGIFKEAGVVPDPEPEPKAVPEGGYDEDSPYAQLNALALANLPKWIMDVGLPEIRRGKGYLSYTAVAGWRESARGPGIPFEKRVPNLKISSKAIKDFGADKGYSPIDLVMAARGCDRATAIGWLQERLMPSSVSEATIDRLVEALKEPPSDDGALETDAEETEAKGTTLPPLTIGQWRSRDDVEDPDFLMGEMLSTTSRMLLVAATGLGKTQLATALAIHVAAGKDFLHWKAARPAKVLYIDGEMSKRQLRKRILDLARRFTGPEPETLYFLSHEDVPNFAPLNTKAGQKWLDGFIERLGGVDLIIFDSIMCLTLGEQKDPDVWRAVIPWARDLTTRGIGQVWVHHTGHDESRSYGDKSREWQLDVVAILTKEDDGGFVSFKMEFKKARERHQDNHLDFAPRKVSLAHDEWVSNPTEPSRSGKATKPKTASDHALDILAELMRTKAVDFSQALGRKAVFHQEWNNAVVDAGVCGRSSFYNLRKNLKEAGKIAELAGFVWIAAPQAGPNRGESEAQSI